MSDSDAELVIDQVATIGQVQMGPAPEDGGVRDVVDNLLRHLHLASIVRHQFRVGHKKAAILDVSSDRVADHVVAQSQSLGDLEDPLDAVDVLPAVAAESQLYDSAARLEVQPPLLANLPLESGIKLILHVDVLTLFSRWGLRIDPLGLLLDGPCPQDCLILAEICLTFKHSPVALPCCHRILIL